MQVFSLYLAMGPSWLRYHHLPVTATYWSWWLDPTSYSTLLSSLRHRLSHQGAVMSRRCTALSAIVAVMLLSQSAMAAYGSLTGKYSALLSYCHLEDAPWNSKTELSEKIWSHARLERFCVHAGRASSSVRHITRTGSSPRSWMSSLPQSRQRQLSRKEACCTM